RLVRGVEGLDRARAAHAPGRRARRRGGAAARAAGAGRGGIRARCAALEGRLPRRRADGATRDPDRDPARRRARSGRDGAAAVHGGDRQRHHPEPRRPDERASGADLPGRRPGPGSPRGARLGRGAGPRDHDPAPDAHRTDAAEEEPTDMSAREDNKVADEIVTEPGAYELPPETPSPQVSVRRTSRPEAGEAPAGARARSVRIEALNAWYG